MSLRAATSLACLLAALVGGCEKGVIEAPIVAGTLPLGEVPLDALSRRHGRLRQRLETRGYVEVPPSARVFATEAHGVVLPLDLELGACTTFVALATGGVRDLRLTLYDGEGDPVAHDEVAGEGGLVHACPETVSADERLASFYLAVETRDGTGSIAIGQFRSEPGEGDGFEGLWDEVLAPRVPFPDVDARLAEARTVLRARGLSPIDAPRVAWVGEGAALRLPLRFERAQCYVATARGGAGTRDVDLFLFDPGGVEVGRDLGTDAEPTIEHCPESAGIYIVEARAFEGEGAIGLMVLGAAAPRDTHDEAGDVGRVLDAEGASRSEPTGADLTLGVLAAELAERGFEAPIFASRDASIAPGETRTHEVVVGPGCSLVVASASHEGMDVDLYLADESGHEIDADTAMHATARVRACRSVPTVLRVAVKAYGRDGRYALATMRASTTITDVRDMRLEEAIAVPRVRGFEEVERFTAILDGGAHFARELRIAPGRCIAIAAAGGVDVDDVDLFLRDVSGALVASEAGPSAHATVSRCADVELMVLRLEAVASEGTGEVAFAILEAPAAVTTRPLEAPVVLP